MGYTHCEGQGPSQRRASTAGRARREQQAVARNAAGRHRRPGAGARVPRRAPQPAGACVYQCSHGTDVPVTTALSLFSAECPICYVATLQRQTLLCVDVL